MTRYARISTLCATRNNSQAVNPVINETPLRMHNSEYLYIDIQILYILYSLIFFFFNFKLKGSIVFNFLIRSQNFI